MFARFMARHMMDCSCWTRTLCLGIAPDMLKTYKKLVPACTNEIQQLRQPYTLLEPPPRCLKYVSINHGNAYVEIWPLKSQSWQPHDVQFHGLSGKIPSSTMDVSQHGLQSIGRVALYVHPLHFLQYIDGRLPWYTYTYISLHAAYDSWCFQSYRLLLNVHPGSCYLWLHSQRSGGVTGVCILVLCEGVMYLM